MPTKTIATSIVQKLQEAGHIAYFAGGWVRDFLLQVPSDDIDIATSATTQEVEELFSHTLPIGVSFGIIIVIEEGHQFEIATFRKDEGYLDGRRPTAISLASPEEDAQRRDFTINGMFYDPITEEIFDFVEGKKDLKQGVIRAIGNPHERFLEDRLRMIRAVRYSTRLNFPIATDTTQAILAHAKDLFPAVAIERVWQEFEKMAHFAHFDAALIALHRLHLLEQIFPQLEGVSIEEIQKRVAPIASFPKNTPTIAALLELFPPLSLSEELELCHLMKLSKKEHRFVTILHRVKELSRMPKEWSQENFEWAKLYAHPGIELSITIVAARYPPEKRTLFLEEHVQRQHLLQQAILRIQNNEPLVRAKDLEQVGIAPGKKMGELLKEAQRISINLEIEEREEIIKQLQNSPLWTSPKKMDS